MRQGHPVSLAGATREDIVASSVIKSSIIAMPRSESRVRGEKKTRCLTDPMAPMRWKVEESGGDMQALRKGLEQRCRPDTARATSGKVK
jgi:hypothetical protein